MAGTFVMPAFLCLFGLCWPCAAGGVLAAEENAVKPAATEQKTTPPRTAELGGSGKLPPELPELPRRFYARAGDLMRAKEFQALPEGAMVDPGRIRTIQSNISANFKSGQPLQETIARLKNGTVMPEEIPPIRLFVRDGKVYTLDHRRLVAARLAGVKVRVTRATEAEVAGDWKKFSGKSDGLEIEIREQK